ncbi:hypothetical protein MCUN1_001085 [Malassezia cuniculi]|uniref:Uncharacterized protein n=1 Tax=Malassezia cuniculi TaxID=948313 RepID=A0AAF0EP41_9BASI|nr:hypothetical protein MCUN1_001085 [Malassezia cuniculi]
MSYDPLSQEGAVRRRVAPSVAGSDDPSIPYDTQGLQNVYHQPGQPIGFFAARGTPYQKKFISKKLMLFNIFIAPVGLIIALVLICLPILYGVANHTLAVSVMHVYSSNITSPTEDTFTLTLEGQVKKAGVFPAQLYFRDPIYVKWVTPPPELREVVLGNFTLDRIGVAAGHGRIKQITTFHVMDVEAFGQFSEYLITQKSFTWRMECANVHIEAFNFLPTWSNLKLTKDIVLNGFNNFEDIKILDFQLPSADPDGGISFYATTQLRNPSPFGIQLGRLGVNLSTAAGTFLGSAFSPDVNVTPGINIVNLYGRLQPYFDNSTALDDIGQVMTKYINHEIADTFAVGVYAQSPTGELPSWLLRSVRAMVLSVPLQSPEPINTIKAITIGTFNLTFNKDSPYEPVASSDTLSGEVWLPFGIPLTIVSTQNRITISSEDGSQPYISVDGAYSPAATDLRLVAPGQTAGTLYLTLKDSPMAPVNQTNEAKTAIQQFTKEFTFSGPVRKLFRGEARALSDTPVGRILLDGIKFDVVSGLLGLQGLVSKPTIIQGVDVVGGTANGIQLSVNTTLYNPSNVNVGAGDVTLLLVNNDVIGNVVMRDLNLVIGENNITTESTFTPSASPYGYETLNRFVSGLDTDLMISGYEGSTEITSLSTAFAALRVNTTLPGLRKNLVSQASLVVANTTGITNDVAYSKVSVENPFTSDLQITHIRANITSHGLFIAQVDTDLDFTAKGKTTSTSDLLPLHLNLYPPDLFGLLRALAIQAGEEVERLDAMIALGGYTLSGTTPQTRRKRSELMRRAMFDNFDLPSYVKKAFSVATVNLDTIGTSKVGDYQTDISFVQRNVNLTIDDSIELLLPVLAKPIVQKIVDGAILGIDSVLIIDPQAQSFRTRMKGSITNAGPFNAVIKFPNGLQVSWNGKVLGQIAMPDITLKADVGATLDLEAQFAVSNVDDLTEFTKFMVTNPSFVWTIDAENASVSAIGITVSGVSMSKNVILTGMNNLKNAVTINSYDLPYNDPAGGIHLTANAVVINPSQIGVQLSRFGTSVYSNNTNLGPTSAQSGFTMQPLSNTSIPLAGRLVHQDSDEGLAVLSQIFTDVVHGQSIPVTIKGLYAGPSEVTWLNEGIKALTTNASLPAMHFTVLQSISMNQLTLDFTQQSFWWAPPSSTSNTRAAFAMPFAFPLDIQRTGGEFIAKYKNDDVAALKVPWSPATTDVEKRIMTIRFSNVPMAAYSSKHSQFSQFLADTTRQRNISFGLHGNANAKANTAAGLVTISDIPFSVDTSLPGLQNLAARQVTVSDLDVYHGYKSYLVIKLNAYLYNPSTITIKVGDVSFPMYFDNHQIGTANIYGLVLTPGTNKVPTDAHYAPQGAANTAAGKRMLENYVQGITSDAAIIGSTSATDVESLKEAFSGLNLPTQIPPLKQLLIPQAYLTVPKNVAATFRALTSFQLRNPFTASVNLIKVNAKVTYQGIYVGKIEENLSGNPISAGGHKTITSRTLPLQMNRDLKQLARFVLTLAQNTNTNLGPLREQLNILINMANTETTIRAKPDDNPPNCHSGQQFDVLGAVLAALKNLQVTLNIESTVKIDDYQTDLDFVQQPVPIQSDRTALYLVGVVGKPLVQRIVDGAVLAFDVANISKVTNNGMHLRMSGRLLDAGPFDAYISFPNGVDVIWQGTKMAEIKLPPICASANSGVPNLVTTGDLTITNKNKFTQFAKYLLHNEDFTWTISSNKVRVQALETIFDDVKLTKQVSFKAFNNLPGVAITYFDIPGQTSNSLKIKTTTTIPSPATLGIDLETAKFQIYAYNGYQGWAQSNNLFLAPASVTSSSLTGEITKRTSNQQTEATGKLFSLYLQGKNQTLTITGDSVTTRENGNKPVDWLSEAFRTLSLKVVLPGKIYKIVYSITVQDLRVEFTKPSHTWAPNSGSNQTIAVFANPLRFELQPIRTGFDIYFAYGGVDAARVQLGLTRVSAGTSSGPNDFQTMSVGFKNVPLQAVNHAAFSNMLDQVTNQQRARIGIHGGANLIAKLVIGNIPINGVPLSVNTSLAGLNALNGKADIYKTADVIDTSATQLDATASMRLTNPSNITLVTSRLSLPLVYKELVVARAVLTDFTLVPGVSTLEGMAYLSVPESSRNDSRYMELFQRIAQPQLWKYPEVLPYYTDVTVDGSASSDPPLTPYASLVQAVSKLKLSGSLPGVGKNLLESLDILIDVLQNFSGPGGLPYGFLYIHFANWLPQKLDLRQINVDAFRTAEQYDPTNHADRYATFTSNQDDCVVPAARSTGVDPGKLVYGPIPNILLPKGVIGSIPILLEPCDPWNLVHAYLGEKSKHYFLPGLKYVQNHVPTTYSISIGTNVVLNITDTVDFVGDLVKVISGLDSSQKKKVSGDIQNLGLDQIGDLINRGFRGAICALEDLPFSFIHTADCSSDSTAAKTSNNSSGGSGSSSSGSGSGSSRSSSGSSRSSSGGSRSSSAGGRSSTSQASSSSSSDGGFFGLGNIFG